VDTQLLIQRLEITRDYLACVEELDTTAWEVAYERYLAGNATLPEQLALAHPKHYLPFPGSAAIRGPRLFTQSLFGPQGCQAEVLWAYACQRTTVFGAVADHLSPWSLGGPTAATNMLFLCALHNQLKGSDIHMYPWEAGEPPWLRPTLHAIAHLRPPGT
jgi:hypothetical protein